MANSGTTVYPGALDSFNRVGTTNYRDESGYSDVALANQAMALGTQITNVLGTTAGTSVLKDFTAGQFPARVNTGGTILQTLTGGTINTTNLGTATLTSPLFQGSLDGWISANETWTYASADAPTFTITVPAGAASKYSVGIRIKLTQTTVKHFIITAVADTVLTVYGGTDYTLVDAAISANYYSTMKAPLGFPLDPIKWTVQTKDTTLRSQATPTQNTWYNLGSVNIVIPIGAWRVNYRVALQINDATSAYYTIMSTLSTANNSESDSEFSLFSTPYVVTSCGIPHFTEKLLMLASKTTYYINTRTTMANIDGIYNMNGNAPLIINAVCTYL